MLNLVLVVSLVITAIYLLFLVGTRSKVHQVEAQFIEPVSFIGCIFVVWNMIGIISSVLAIIAGSIKVFLYFVGG